MMNETNRTVSLDEMSALVGSELGVSEWTHIDQKRIDAFAEIRRDHQFIHVDPVRAKDTPMGTTIAHGFLVLSLVAGLGQRVIPNVRGAKMGMNYGINKLRFVSPVKTGARVRARFTLKTFGAQNEGRYMSTIDVAVEIEGQDKPALVLEWLTMTFV
jgi:acyl dehydratase